MMPALHPRRTKAEAARRRTGTGPSLASRVVPAERLDDLQPAWETCRTAAPSPQWRQRLELVRDWTPGRPGAVVTEADGEVVGLAPFTRSRRPVVWHVRLRARRHPVLRASLDTVELVGGALAVPAAGAVQDHLWGAFLDAAREADVVRLTGVPEGGPLDDLVRRPRTRPRGWLRFTDHEPEFHHRAELADDVATYLARQVGPRSRRYLERDVRRITRDAVGARVEVFTEGVDVPRFLALVARVERQSWHARRHATPVCRPGTGPRLRAWADLGLLRSYVLSVGDEPIAFLLAYAGDGCLHVAKMGYAECWARRSPGKVLLWLVLDDIHRHPHYSSCDLGPGRWPFKDVFAGDGFPVRNTTYVRLRPRALAVVVPPLVWQRLRSTAACAVAGSARGTAVRQWIRRNLAR